MSIQDIYGVLNNILQGLSYLKTQQIIHYDLKPDNIVITEDGTNKLMDFGLSINLDKDKTS